jgi:hypothetical protein
VNGCGMDYFYCDFFQERKEAFALTTRSRTWTMTSGKGQREAAHDVMMS